MNMNGIKKKLSLILCIVLIAAMALCTIGCSDTETTDGAAAVITMEEGKTYGEGATEFTFTSVDKDTKETTVTIRTDKTTVGEALMELGLIAGEEGEFGLYVQTVNGTTLTWEEDQMYWSFYIDGDYAMTGVDQTDIVPGCVYTLKAEKG